MPLDPPDAVAALAAALRSAGYCADGVRRAIGSGPAVAIAPADIPAIQSRLDHDSDLASMIELFLLGLDASADAVNRALADVPLDALAASGVIDFHQGVVRARIRILPYEDLLIACDRDPVLDGRLEHDHVGGVHASSVLLARITPRRPVERALDVGCGCGFQSLLLARHAREVVATDVNPRALDLGWLGAHLNGIDNVEWRLGDGLEPVRGERFDLIVSNPPYVIAPRARFTFRESPLAGDAFCERLTRDAPALLADNGVACMLASWIVAGGENWSARPAAWTENVGRGRVLLHLESVDAATNAVRWAIPAGDTDRVQASALVREWLDYYRANAIQTIAYGGVIFHPTPGLTRIELAGAPGPEGPSHVERIIDGHALLAIPATAGLLDAVLRLPPRHRLDWTLVAEGGGWRLLRSQLSIDGGLGLGVELDRPTARLVAALDGRHRLRELLGDALRDAPLDRLAELLSAGLLEVVTAAA